jgi:hypothetical protein
VQGYQQDTGPNQNDSPHSKQSITRFSHTYSSSEVLIGLLNADQYEKPCGKSEEPAVLGMSSASVMQSHQDHGKSTCGRKR